MRSFMYTNFTQTTVHAYLKIASLTVIPAIMFWIKTFRNIAVIEINNKSFFYQNALLTGWNNFISAKYTQEEKMLSLSDSFVLPIEYLKPGRST